MAINDLTKERKMAIIDSNRVRMHLQSAISHLKFVSPSYLIPQRKKDILINAILDCEIIEQLLDSKIATLEDMNKLDEMVEENEKDV